MNADDFPRVPRRRAATLALRGAVGWTQRVTDPFALFFVVLAASLYFSGRRFFVRLVTPGRN